MCRVLRINIKLVCASSSKYQNEYITIGDEDGMASLGRIEPYDGNSDLDAYLERVKLYFIANNIGSVSSDSSETTVLTTNLKTLPATIVRKQDTLWQPAERKLQLAMRRMLWKQLLSRKRITRSTV